MLLGFKRCFAPFVENGSKTHAIRGERKIPPKVGEICHCYVDPRQKSMRLLGRWPCVKIERIHIAGPQEYHWSEIEVRIGGVELSHDEKEELAFRDGFRSYLYANHFAEMIEFWAGRLPFDGIIIHWDYTRPLNAQRRAIEQFQAEVLQ